MAEIVAIVLAAGRAARFAASRDGQGDDRSKVYALLDGRPLVAHVAAAASASRAVGVIVVTGRDAAIAPAALLGFDVTLAHNSAFADGMASSIAAGLAAVPVDADAAIVMLADMPRVAAATLDALIDAFERERPDAVVPCHHGRRGNPVLVSRSLFPSLMRLAGDEGARGILAKGTTRVLAVEVDDPGVLLDVDTADALAALAAPA